MRLRFQPIDQWPDGWRERSDRPYSPFTATWEATLALLERELVQLGVDEALLQVDASSRDCRLDGQLRSDARVGHPGVIVTIDSPKLGALVYSCDRFAGGHKQPGWKVNLRAIALGLEALRKVERYGIADRGQQYAGFGALPPARPMGPSMTVDEALALLKLGHYARNVEDLPADEVRRAWKRIAGQHHPDVGGDAETFRKLTEARDLLLR